MLLVVWGNFCIFIQISVSILMRFIGIWNIVLLGKKVGGDENWLVEFSIFAKDDGAGGVAWLGRRRGGVRWEIGWGSRFCINLLILAFGSFVSAAKCKNNGSKQQQGSNYCNNYGCSDIVLVWLSHLYLFVFSWIVQHQANSVVLFISLLHLM